METTNKKQFLFGMSAFTLAVITAIISILVLFAIGYPLQSFKFNGMQIGDWIAYIITGILISIACFFICREYPKSIWYVLIISNAIGIIPAFVESNFWITNMWKQNLCVWVLSILSGLIGASAGKQKAAKV